MEVDQKQNDEVYFTNYWTPLRITIESFLQPEPNSGLSSFHETFSLIYKCVCDGRATKLYTDLLELCSSHLKTVHVHLMNLLTADQTSSQQEKISKLVIEFDKQLSIYLKASSNISSVFCYLVKFLEEKLNYGCPLESQLKKIFCQEVAEHYVYEILDCLNSSSAPNLDPVLVQRLLNNLKIVSQHKYSTRYLSLYSRYEALSDPHPHSHPHQQGTPQGVQQSRVSVPGRMYQQDVAGTDFRNFVVLGLNPAQKRRADEID